MEIDRMKIINKLLDYSTPWALPDVYLFTGNSIVKNNGALVMGRGAAKQIRDYYQEIDTSFGNMILKDPQAHILWAALQKKKFLGWFKVKNHWADPAEIELIKESAKQLTKIALERKNITFHMNYPGIGNGKLKIEDVKHILSILPDNVLIYKL